MGVAEYASRRSVLDHALHDFMEIWIAGVDDGFLQVVKGVRPVAADDVSIAGNTVGGAQHPPVHGYQSFQHFDNAARAVGRAKGTVEKRLARVVNEAVVIRPAVPSCEQIGPVAWGTDHGEDFTRRRFNGNNGSPHVGHDAFPVRLQLQIQSQLDVVPGSGSVSSMPDWAGSR